MRLEVGCEGEEIRHPDRKLRPPWPPLLVPQPIGPKPVELLARDPHQREASDPEARERPRDGEFTKATDKGTFMKMRGHLMNINSALRGEIAKSMQHATGELKRIISRMSRY